MNPSVPREFIDAEYERDGANAEAEYGARFRDDVESFLPSFSTLTTTVFIGKGFGDLPDSMAWLRPVIVTANFGVALTTQSTTLSTRTLPTRHTAVT